MELVAIIKLLVIILHYHHLKCTGPVSVIAIIMTLVHVLPSDIVKVHVYVNHYT